MSYIPMLSSPVVHGSGIRDSNRHHLWWTAARFRLRRPQFHQGRSPGHGRNLHRRKFPRAPGYILRFQVQCRIHVPIV